MNENNISAPDNNNEAPIKKLYDHFKILHSAPDNSTLSSFHLNVLEEKKLLEKNKHLHSELDDSISTEEIEKANKKNLKTRRPLALVEYVMKC